MKPDRRITPAEVWPIGWKSLLTNGLIGIGGDIGTTAKEKSNPSAIAVTELVGGDYIVRCVVRFKTNKPEVYEEVLRYALDLPDNKRVRRVCLEATSERFFAAALRSKLAGKVVVELVIASENVKYMGEEMKTKTFLGNQFVGLMDDGRVLLPQAAWLRDDLRSVKRVEGGFEADVDEMGNHADCFEAIKLSIHALRRGGGPVSARAARVGGYGGEMAGRSVKNPLANRESSEVLNV